MPIVSIGDNKFLINTSVLDACQVNVSMWGRTFSLKAEESSETYALKYNEILKALANYEQDLSANKKSDLWRSLKKLETKGYQEEGNEEGGVIYKDLNCFEQFILKLRHKWGKSERRLLFKELEDKNWKQLENENDLEFAIPEEDLEGLENDLEFAIPEEDLEGLENDLEFAIPEEDLEGLEDVEVSLVKMHIFAARRTYLEISQEPLAEKKADWTKCYFPFIKIFVKSHFINFGNDCSLTMGLIRTLMHLPKFRQELVMDLLKGMESSKKQHQLSFYITSPDVFGQVTGWADFYQQREEELNNPGQQKSDTAANVTPYLPIGSSKKQHQLSFCITSADVFGQVTGWADFYQQREEELNNPGQQKSDTAPSVTPYLPFEICKSIFQFSISISTRELWLNLQMKETLEVAKGMLQNMLWNGRQNFTVSSKSSEEWDELYVFCMPLMKQRMAYSDYDNAEIVANMMAQTPEKRKEIMYVVNALNKSDDATSEEIRKISALLDVANRNDIRGFLSNRKFQIFLHRILNHVRMYKEIVFLEEAITALSTALSIKTRLPHLNTDEVVERLNSAWELDISTAGWGMIKSFLEQMPKEQCPRSAEIPLEEDTPFFRMWRLLV